MERSNKSIYSTSGILKLFFSSLYFIDDVFFLFNFLTDDNVYNVNDHCLAILDQITP